VGGGGGGAMPPPPTHTWHPPFIVPPLVENLLAGEQAKGKKIRTFPKKKL